MNDIIGADIKCPKCKISYLTPQIINGKVILFCCKLYFVMVNLQDAQCIQELLIKHIMRF